MAPYARGRRCRRRAHLSGRDIAAPIAAGIILAAIAHSAPGHTTPAHAAHASGSGRRAAARAVAGAAASAVAYARAQLGKPYAWGGTGPGAFDCSGLIMMAYRAAGITIPRTSQAQWAWGPRVTRPQPGDLVFFTGADGTPAAPGHVGLVIGRHTMIEAFAVGYPVRMATFAAPAAAPGDGDPVGFTRPWAHTRARR